MILLAGVMQVPKLQAHEHIHTHSSLSVASVLFLDQADPADGALFSEAARERTLAQHTSDCRARDFEQVLDAAASGRLGA